MTASVFLALFFVPTQTEAPGAPVCLAVQPMAAPKPAMKYQLLPEVREMTPGNPYQGYIKCFMEQRNFYFTKPAVSERMRILSMPLDQVAKDYGDYPGNLRYADYAARLDTLDWQLTQRIQSEGLEFQAGELPALRALVIALQTRLRVRVANKKFAEAIEGAKTMFKLARDLGEYPAPEANLFGIATVNMALDTFEEMLQQPGCPNLYWALTDLPSPLVELRKGLQGHACLVNNEFKPLRNDAVMTDTDLEKVVSRLSGMNGLAREQAGRPPWNWRAGLEARVKNADNVRLARERLAADSVDKALANRFLLLALVAKFSPLQVILIDEKRDYELRRDERMKLLALAPWQIDALPAPKSPGDSLFQDLLPDVGSLRRSQARLEQRIALLRVIEALRLYAAEHGAKLPESLAEVTLALPSDPVSGKPVVYELSKGTAHIRGAAPRGEEKNPEFNLHYEVTIKK